jgi:hypothetical protein
MIMNRRKFGLMAGCSALALIGTSGRAVADTPDASTLTTTLTPFGAERAGNAAGTIPAWTGGLTEVPAGVSWDPDSSLPPDFYASDAMLYRVDASNLAQYADLLSDGVQTLIKDKGFYINVYPTRRTHALPQWVYDNIAANVTRVTPENGDYRLGFNGGYGGIPCPILSSDPAQAGAQLIWNHEARWTGPWQAETVCGYTVENGTPILVSGQRNYFRYDYYQQGTDPQSFDRRFYTVLLRQFAPSTVAGGQALGYNSTIPQVFPIMSWTLLQGQGRVRKTPNLQFDTPSSYVDAITNYDENFGFNGATYKYDWKLLGKKEMLIPYNNNKIFSLAAPPLHKPNFFDPEAVRWELHRVWQVEATLHEGERNVISRRMFYLDEDTSMIGLNDSWDSAGNLIRVQYNLNANFPNLPGTIYMNTISYAIQTGNYVSNNGSYGDAPYNEPWRFTPLPASNFLPQTMAASASY